MKLSDRLPLIVLAVAIAFATFGGSLGGCELPLPVVTSAPFPADCLSVLIVEETDARKDLPQSQLDAIMSTEWRQYVYSVGGEYRTLDRHTDVSRDAEKWQAAMAVQRDGVPWVVISNGKDGYSGPLPATTAELTQLIRKYGGDNG